MTWGEAHVDLPWLAFVFLLASLPMGYFGYGFSTVALPLLLLRHSNVEVVPLLNMVEVFQNAGLLAMNRQAVKGSALRQALPMAIGVVPGTVLGAYVLKSAEPTTLKIGVLALLLPLIYLQAFDVRRPIKDMRIAGPALGLIGGVLYGTTTISGPLFAIVFVNNGLAKGDFRANMAMVRLVESWIAMPVYAALGLTSYGTLVTAVMLFPLVVAGMYLGQLLAGRVQPGSFRHYAMIFDASLVTYSLHVALTDLSPPELSLIPVTTTAMVLALWVRRRLLSLSYAS